MCEKQPESPADRARYRIFALWGTLAFVALFVVSLRSVWLGSLVLTVYLTWSPWHYTGQNYGICLMLLRRRGVDFDAGLKRWIYASFVLSYLLTFLAVHSGGGGSSYAPVSYGGTVFRLIKLGIPYDLGSALLAAAAVAYGACLLVAGRRLLRITSLRSLGPALVLVFTQSMWFSIPVLVRHWDVMGQGAFFDRLYGPVGFLWIAGAHSLQYLWITGYYASRAPDARSGLLSFLLKACLAGYAVWTLPALLFAPGVLGSLPHESGLAVMVASVVNLHHFVLDGAIWKLRDGRVARVLLRSEPRPSGATGAVRNGWVARGVQIAGACCLIYGLGMLVAGDFGFQRAVQGGRLAEAAEALDRSARLGRDGPRGHVQLGRRLARAGRLDEARDRFERSIALQPTAEAWQSLGLLHEQQRRPAMAAEAYEAAAELQPSDAGLHYRAGLLWLRLGEIDRAEAALSRALEIAPDEQRIRKSLDRARARRPSVTG